MLSEGFYRVYRAPECEFGSLGLSLVAGRAPEPLLGARGRSGVSLIFFVWPSRILFVQKEGWNMSGYPWWARAVTSPVSYYWVVQVEARAPIR